MKETYLIYFFISTFLFNIKMCKVERAFNVALPAIASKPERKKDTLSGKALLLKSLEQLVRNSGYF